MIMYNPWHGCHKYSEGCQNCYMFYFDSVRGIDSNIVKKTNDFNLPIKKDRYGKFKIESGQSLQVCLTSDFFIEEADEWRNDVWKMIKERQDLQFTLFTKRANRILTNLPKDFTEFYNHVEFAVTCENQKRLDERMPYLASLPTKNISLLLSPMLEEMDIDKILKTGKIKKVYISGENYKNARILDFDWVKKIQKQCKDNSVKLEFFHTGSKFIKDGRLYTIPYSKGKSQAKLANIDLD